MTDLPDEPPLEWLNAAGKRIYEEGFSFNQEFALIQAREVWEEPRFAQMAGEEAVNTYLQERDDMENAVRAQWLLDGITTTTYMWIDAYQDEWSKLCAGECDFEGPYVETYDLWHKHKDSDPKLVAMQRFMEVYTPEQRERYRQMKLRKPWNDLTA